MNAPDRCTMRTAGVALALALAICPLHIRAATGPKTVQVVTLGTGGGPVTRLERAQSSNAVVVGDVIYIVDAGDGALRQLTGAGLKLASVRAIFITHHHLDHVAGLAPLLGLRWMRTVNTPLKLLGPRGLRQVVDGFGIGVQPAVDVDFTGGPQPLDAVEVREIERPGVLYEDENIRVLSAENSHYHAPLANPGAAPKSYAYRIETPRGVIVFTGDTGPSDAVTRLAAGADLLIAEVIDLEGTVRAVAHLAPDLTAERRASLVDHLTQDHLLPEQVGRLAKTAGVKHVVLSHLAPGLDTETSTDAYSSGVSEVYGGPVTVAADLMVFPLQGTARR